MRKLMLPLLLAVLATAGCSSGDPDGTATPAVATKTGGSMPARDASMVPGVYQETYTARPEQMDLVELAADGRVTTLLMGWVGRADTAAPVTTTTYTYEKTSEGEGSLTFTLADGSTDTTSAVTVSKGMRLYDPSTRSQVASMYKVSDGSIFLDAYDLGKNALTGTWGMTDDFGRTSGYVFLPDGTGRVWDEAIGYDYGMTWTVSGRTLLVFSSLGANLLNWAMLDDGEWLFYGGWFQKAE